MIFGLLILIALLLLGILNSTHKDKCKPEHMEHSGQIGSDMEGVKTAIVYIAYALFIGSFVAVLN